MSLANRLGALLGWGSRSAPPARIDAIHARMAAGELDQAHAQMAALIDAFPGDPKAHHLMGLIQWRRLQYAEAEVHTRKSLKLDASQAVLWANLAAISMDRGQFVEAEQALNQALARAPDDPVALEMLSVVKRHAGNTEGSLGILERVLRLDPRNASAHLSRALTLLQAGRFEEGWREYEWRWSPALSGPDAFPRIARWDGSELGERRLFLWCDAQLGDAIQFARFLPEVRRRFPRARLSLGCLPQLRELFQRSFPEAELIDASQVLPPVDLHCPLMGLPLRLGHPAAGVPAFPYLRVSTEKAAIWKRRIEALGLGEDSLRIGLVWSGNAYSRDPSLYSMAVRRNVPFDALRSLLELDRVTFFSLQMGAAAAEATQRPRRSGFIDWTAELNSLDDTAALLSRLDMVISVDTSLAHLAAALDRPVWMLARYDTCWRWYKNRADTPWYPSMRIFSQERAGDWASVAGQVLDALKVAGAEKSARPELSS